MTRVKQWKWNKIRHFSIGHIQIWHHIFLYQKLLKYFNDFQNQNFSVLWLKWTWIMEITLNQTFFHRTYSNLTPYLSLSKNIKIFQWLSKSNFSVLWLKWTQIMDVTLNQTFFHRTYSNLTPYLSLSKIIKIFQRLSKLKFLSFMTNVNQNNGVKQNQIYFCGHIWIILKCFNDIYNWNFSISL